MDWTERNTRFFSLALPLVGFVLAAAWLAAFLLLSCWDVTPFLRGILMGLVVLTVTGGLHRDGLMDSCDAIFSHRDRETRLRSFKIFELKDEFIESLDDEDKLEELEDENLKENFSLDRKSVV